MTTEEYMRRVIELFKSDRVTEGQWLEMARAVACASWDHDTAPLIDDAVGLNNEED